MAKSDPVIIAVSKYLKGGFSKHEKLDLSSALSSSDSKVVFSYKEVKEALFLLKCTDPTLHCLLGYQWQTSRSRNDIADSLWMDSSTLKRGWDKATRILLNYLVNSEVVAELEPIDILYKEAKEQGKLRSVC